MEHSGGDAHRAGAHRARRPTVAPWAAGFTLLEVLVAVAILGVATAVIMELFQLGLRASTVAGDYAEAVFLAQAKMGEVLSAETLEEGGDSGTFDNGYGWEYQVEPYTLVSPEGEDVFAPLSGEDPVTEILRIEVTVRFPDSNKQLRLETLHTRYAEYE